MKAQQTNINQLAREAVQGNDLAKTQLREKLEAGMIVIVKRTLKSGYTTTVLSRKIMEEFRRIAQCETPPSKTLPVHIVVQIAKSICDLLLSRLDAKFLANPLLETVAECA